MRSLVLTASLLLATGCTVAVVDDGSASDEEDTTTATAQGNVAVERVVAVGDGAVGRTHVSARFVRVSGGIDQRTAERVVGSSRLDHDAAPGCSWQLAPAPATPSEGSIELLDVGDIVVRAGTRALPLAARAFPDVGDLVSGVVYTSRDHSTELPEASTYSIETSGSSWVEGFSVQVEAPASPAGVFVSQPSFARLGIDRLPLDADELVFESGEELMVAWDAGRPALGDRIYIDLVVSEPTPQRLRCVFEDDGEGMVPALNGFAEGAEIDIALHRHRRTTVRRAAGAIDEAIVDFDFAVAARALTSE